MFDIVINIVIMSCHYVMAGWTQEFEMHDRESRGFDLVDE